MAGRKRLSFRSNAITRSNDQQSPSSSIPSLSVAPSPIPSAPSPPDAPSPQGTVESSSTPQSHIMVHVAGQLSQQEEQNIESQEKQIPKVRGPTRGVGTDQLIKRGGNKLMFDYRDSELRVHGANAPRFSNEVGLIVHHNAPLQYSGWSKIPKNDETAMLKQLMEAFDVDLEMHPHLVDVIDNTFSERFKDYRDAIDNGLNPLDNKPFSYLKAEDWKWMCKNCFESESWKKKSAAGKANRSKSAPYMGGSKSLVQHLEEYQNSMKELLTEKLSQLPEGSQLPSDEEEEIYSQVLSNQKYEKYGFKRGTGPIVKRKATTSSAGGPSQRAFVQNLEDIRSKLSESFGRNGAEDENTRRNDGTPSPAAQ